MFFRQGASNSDEYRHKIEGSHFYDPRFACVVVLGEQVREIEKYYDRCVDECSTNEQINASKIAMSKTKILLHTEIKDKETCNDMSNYEKFYAEKPKIIQKSMIVCMDRKIALKVLQAIILIRTVRGIAKKNLTTTKNLLSD